MWTLDRLPGHGACSGGAQMSGAGQVGLWPAEGDGHDSAPTGDTGPVGPDLLTVPEKREVQNLV